MMKPGEIFTIVLTLIAWATPNGQTCDASVEFVDIDSYATLCELACVPFSTHLEGGSMKPLYSRPEQAAYSQFRRQDEKIPLMGYALRTDRYRCIEWQDRPTHAILVTELYDHQNEFSENNNTAGCAENKSLPAQLNRQMRTTLPQSPKFVPPGPQRPQITFKNGSTVPLTLFWIAPDGKQQKKGVIEPGRQISQVSTTGHRFRVRGADGSSRTFEVTTQRQTFEFESESTTSTAIDEHLPNIVFCMADDWSWPHAGILGDPVVKTPHFDRIAREGVLFENAFVSTPSCTPSRLSVLTGQHHWRLQEGDSLGGSLREHHEVYTEMLQKVGYRIGRFGKGVWPSRHTFRNRDSFGERFRSFDEFIKGRKAGEPFCYWHGGQDPHRPYELGVGRRSGMKLSEVNVPACLPDNETVRSDVADYLWEVQRFDREVGEIVTQLKALDELENTIIVITGDNGMPFPRCKATLYDQGTRVPLAVRWGSKVMGGRQVTDFVSLCDLAPTFLEAAGVNPSKQMTGRSLIPLLKTSKSGQIDPARTFVLTGLEKHVYPYPSRGFRTRDFLFIRKFNSDQWPTGEVAAGTSTYDFATQPWPTETGAFSFNIDPSPSKQFLRLHRNEKDTKRFADLAFLKHQKEEVYDLRKDPDQLCNVADDPNYGEISQRLRQKLQAELIRNDDPRLTVDGFPN